MNVLDGRTYRHYTQLWFEWSQELHSRELDKSGGVEVRGYRNADRERKMTKRGSSTIRNDTTCVPQDEKPTRRNKLSMDEALALGWGQQPFNERRNKVRKELVGRKTRGRNFEMVRRLAGGKRESSSSSLQARIIEAGNNRD